VLDIVEYIYYILYIIDKKRRKKEKKRKKRGWVRKAKYVLVYNIYIFLLNWLS